MMELINTNYEQLGVPIPNRTYTLHEVTRNNMNTDYTWNWVDPLGIQTEAAQAAVDPLDNF